MLVVPPRPKIENDVLLCELPLPRSRVIRLKMMRSFFTGSSGAMCGVKVKTSPTWAGFESGCDPLAYPNIASRHCRAPIWAYRFLVRPVHSTVPYPSPRRSDLLEKWMFRMTSSLSFFSSAQFFRAVKLGEPITLSTRLSTL
jgi:hypothetical protein